MAAATDLLVGVGDPGSATTLDANYTAGDGTVTVVSTSNWTTTGVAVIFAIDEVTIIDGVEVQTAGTYNEFEGTVASATSITNVDQQRGSGDRNYSAGTTTRVYIPVSAERENRLVEWGSAEHDPADGTHTDITADTVTAGSFIVTGAGGVGGGWETGIGAPDTVTYNGNRSYDMVFNSLDHTDLVSPGMRLRTTRNTAAPDQCADLEASSSQYFDKSSPTGITFTDDFTCSAWVKLESYAPMSIVSRRTASTAGFDFRLLTTGQIDLGSLRIASNNRFIRSYQSIPLGRWVHIAATMDNSSDTHTVYLDGVSIPFSNVLNGSVTALVQSGNLQIGGYTGGNQLFDGKIAQVGLFDAVLTGDTIRSLASQGLTGSETNCVGAWSLDNSLLDLTSNNNDLTAQGSALATDTDSPFGNLGLSTTLDYGIVTAASFSTNTTLTVQVPEGCTIPTLTSSGDVSAVAYSRDSAPYGFVRDSGRWSVEVLSKDTSSALTSATWVNGGSIRLSVPIGSWAITAVVNTSYSRAGTINGASQLSESSSAITGGYETSGSFFRSITEGGASLYSAIEKEYGALTIVYLLENGVFTSGSLSISQSQTHYIRAECAYL